MRMIRANTLIWYKIFDLFNCRTTGRTYTILLCLKSDWRCAYTLEQLSHLRRGMMSNDQWGDYEMWHVFIEQSMKQSLSDLKLLIRQKISGSLVNISEKRSRRGRTFTSAFTLHLRTIYTKVTKSAGYHLRTIYTKVTKSAGYQERWLPFTHHLPIIYVNVSPTFTHYCHQNIAFFKGFSKGSYTIFTKT